MSGVDPQTLVLLCAVAGLAGCVDAIGGGGGLLTVPALMLTGLDPVSAIATNKAQGAAGDLIFIGGADSTTGGANFFLAAPGLTRLVKRCMIRQDQGAGWRYFKAFAHRNTLGLQLGNFLKGGRR